MKRTQSGLTLFVAMIILVMITLLVVSAFRVSNTNLKIVGAMQGRQEAVASSQAAIEQVLSSKFFTENPTIVANTPIDIDINDLRAIFGIEWETQTQARGHFEVGYVFDREIVFAGSGDPTLDPDDTIMLRLGFDF